MLLSEVTRLIDKSAIFGGVGVTSLHGSVCCFASCVLKPFFFFDGGVNDKQ